MAQSSSPARPAQVLHMKYPLSKTGVRVGVTLAIVVGFAAAAQNGQSPEKRITPAEVQWPAASGAGVGTSGVTGIQTVVLKGDPTSLVFTRCSFALGRTTGFRRTLTAMTA